jgi:hypothetical protein
MFTAVSTSHLAILLIVLFVAIAAVSLLVRYIVRRPDGSSHVEGHNDQDPQ